MSVKIDMLPNDAWSWFALYLATGIVAFLVARMVVTWTLKPDKRSQGVSDVTRSTADARSIRTKSREIAEMLLFIALILLVWPPAIAMALTEHFYPGTMRWTPAPPYAFTCHRKHLVRVVAPRVAEAEALVVDPLGRAPALPFGHLNAGWRALLAAMTSGDKLWYFEVPGHTPVSGGAQQQPQWSLPRGDKRGYALVRMRKVRAEFVFEWD